jgi:hypothetical protein
MNRRQFAILTSATPAAAQSSRPAAPLHIGTRRELAIDHEWIETLRGAELRPGTPIEAGRALTLDHPWEGAFSAYTTVLHAPGEPFRMYYRGSPAAGRDGNQGEVTCYAESRDGREFTKPALRLHDVADTRENNVILAGQAPYAHNFSPFIDTRPGVAEAERFKAIAGVSSSGLRGFVSAGGIRWRALRDEPLLPPTRQTTYDSQNIAFWSAHEGCYVLYYRTWRRINGVNYRHVSRVTSPDFLHWSEPVEMDFGETPPEHLYTNQTAPYFRAPHIYVGICARFFPGRQVLNEEQARAAGVNPNYFKDCSDAVMISTRGGSRYQRTFMEAFLRPGLGLENWVSRSNYPALNLAPTGEGEMSFYVNRNYGQPTAHIQRYRLRLDGLGSVHAAYTGGEAVSRPLIFTGARLELNYSTSAAGSIRVELQDDSGRPLPGRALADAPERVGDEIAGIYRWPDGGGLDGFAGKPVRLRMVLKDADLYSFRFRA